MAAAAAAADALIHRQTEAETVELRGRWHQMKIKGRTAKQLGIHLSFSAFFGF